MGTLVYSRGPGCRDPCLSIVCVWVGGIPHRILVTQSQPVVSFSSSGYHCSLDTALDTAVSLRALDNTLGLF